MRERDVRPVYWREQLFSLSEYYERQLIMSPFSRLRAAFTTADDGEYLSYECKTCGARFVLQRQVCPECGGYSFDHIDWSSNDSHRE